MRRINQSSRYLTDSDMEMLKEVYELLEDHAFDQAAEDMHERFGFTMGATEVEVPNEKPENPEVQAAYNRLAAELEEGCPGNAVGVLRAIDEFLDAVVKVKTAELFDLLNTSEATREAK